MRLSFIPLVLVGGETLFVSLGSSCAPAHLLRDAGLRKSAFPFDWILSFNGERLIHLLQEDFQKFTYVTREGDIFYNPWYELRFVHDGYDFQSFQSKYARRIARFRELDRWLGKVIFLRFAYPQSAPEISDEEALRLDAALRDYFPHLGYLLVILNLHDRIEVEKDKDLSDRIWIYRFNPRREGNDQAFAPFFHALSESADQNFSGLLFFER